MEALNVVLDDGDYSYISNMEKLSKQLKLARSTVRDLEREIISTQNKMNADVAIKVRKTIPSANIAVNSAGNREGSCKFGNNSIVLYLRPDITSTNWDLDNGGCHDYYGFDKIEELVSSISSLLSANMSESKNVSGSIILDGISVSLKDLVSWRNRQDCKPLNTRMMRNG